MYDYVVYVDAITITPSQGERRLTFTTVARQGRAKEDGHGSLNQRFAYPF